MTRIAVLGTINRDTILLPGGQVRESYGGLLYSILPLAILMEADTAIFPVVNLGRDVQEPVKAILSRYQRISLDGVRVVPQQNNHAILTYRSAGEREEVLEGGVPTLTYEQIAPFLDADILLVNFISGRDLTLETMKRIRANTGATIYADMHSLTLGIDRKGRRYWRQVSNWPEWMAQADVVQVNRREAQLFYGTKMDSEEALLSFGRKVMGAGPSVLLITLGAEGSAMISDSGEGVGLERFRVHSPEQIKDTTGCGDVFLAAFVAEQARSGDSQKASRFANLVAGVKCGLSGIEELETLKDLMAM